MMLRSVISRDKRKSFPSRVSIDFSLQISLESSHRSTTNFIEKDT